MRFLPGFVEKEKLSHLLFIGNKNIKTEISGLTYTQKRFTQKDKNNPSRKPIQCKKENKLNRAPLAEKVAELIRKVNKSESFLMDIKEA